MVTIFVPTQERLHQEEGASGGTRRQGECPRAGAGVKAGCAGQTPGHLSSASIAIPLLSCMQRYSASFNQIFIETLPVNSGFPHVTPQ